MYRYHCFHAVVASLIALAVVQTAGAAPVVTPFNAACPSPVPDASTYNKLIPDRTEIPLPMTVSLQPIMVTDISPRLQTFELTGYLFMSWMDRRLAFNATACNSGKNRYVLTGSDMDKLWRAQLEFPNSKFRAINPDELNVWDTGFVLWVGRIQLTLHADLDVTMFPFDKHVLPMTVEEFDHPSPELHLIPDPNNNVMEVLESSQFRFQREMTVIEHLFPVPQRNTTWDQVTFSFHAERIWQSTFLTSIVPLFFIVGMAVFAFALPRVNSTARVSISITAFLSSMAFSVTLQGSLPPVRYVTRMTLFIMMSYTINFFAFCCAVAVGALKVKYDGLFAAEAARLNKDAASALGAIAQDVLNPLLSAANGASAPEAGIELPTRGAKASTAGGVVPDTRRRAMSQRERASVITLTQEQAKLAKHDAESVKNRSWAARKVRCGGVCQCWDSKLPLALRLKAVAATIDAIIRFFVPVFYCLMAYLLFTVPAGSS